MIVALKVIIIFYPFLCGLETICGTMSCPVMLNCKMVTFNSYTNEVLYSPPSKGALKFQSVYEMRLMFWSDKYGDTLKSTISVIRKLLVIFLLL